MRAWGASPRQRAAKLRPRGMALLMAGMSAAAVARRLQVGRSTVRRWRREADLPVWRRVPMGSESDARRRRAQARRLSLTWFLVALSDALDKRASPEARRRGAGKALEMAHLRAREGLGLDRP